MALHGHSFLLTTVSNIEEAPPPQAVPPHSSSEFLSGHELHPCKFLPFALLISAHVSTYITDVKN